MNGLEKTKKLARLTRIFCRITIWATAIGTAILMIMVLVTALVPDDRIKPLQDSGNLRILVSGMSVPAEVFTSVAALRDFLIGVMNRVTAGVVIYIIIAVHVMGLLKSVESGEPFAVENVKRLRRISIVLMLGSFLIPSVSTISTAYVDHVSLMDLKGDSMFDLTLLLCGFLVLVLSGIFSYGARLQREHDQTV